MSNKIIDDKSILLLKLTSGETVTVAGVDEICRLFQMRPRSIYYHIMKGNVKSISRFGRLYVDLKSFNKYRKSVREKTSII